jgi:antitoxin PrlF
MTTILTRKGQITIPKAMRDYLGLKPGYSVIFERLSSGEIVINGTNVPPKPISRFAPLRRPRKVSMSTEEILALMRRD